MPITAPPTIAALPSPPDPNNRATFNTLAYPWSVAQQTLATEVGAVAANVYSNAQEAQTQAELATTNGAAQVALAATQASNAATSAADANTAKLAAQAAQAAAEGVISALPDGTVNDATTTLTDTWSSSKISAELATLDGEKQDVLISGTNIKTFGGQSLLGSGDIVPPESWQVGDVIQTARTLSAPDWLPCDGSVYLQSSYAGLYAELGMLGNAARDWKFPSNLGSINQSPYYAAYGNGIVVAIQAAGGFGWAYVSTDGFNWTAVNLAAFLPTNKYARRIAFGNGVFVIATGDSQAGSNEICLTSTDGITWTKRTVGTASASASVFFVNNLFILTTDNSGGNYPRSQIFTSSDGITWTNRTPGTFSGSPPFDGAVYANGVYLLGGSMSVYGVLRSIDGITWALQEVYGFGGSVHSFSYGDGKFVAFTSNGYCHTSVDGITWTTNVAYPLGSGAYPAYTTYFADNLFCAAGSSGRIATSPDGVTWTLRTTTKSPTSHIHSSFLIGSRKFLLGQSSTNCYTQTISSTDSVSWAYSEIAGVVLNASATNGTTTIAVADSGKVYTYSEYGWIPVNTAVFASNNLTFAGYENGLFFTGGVNGLLGTSPDGVTWTLRSSGFGGDTVSLVAYGNGKWVIAGSGAYIGYSADGVTWTTAAHPVGVTFTGLIFHNGQFKLYGNNTTLVSADGVTWTAAANNLESVGSSPTKVKYGLNAYFGVASTGVFRSEDGLFWRKVHIGTSDNYVGLVIANNVVVAVGATSGSLSHFVSYDGFNFYGTKSKFYSTNSFKTVFKHGNKLVAAGYSTNVSDLFNYDTTTQFVTPRAISVLGQSTYIKA